jgi:Cadherin domain
VNLIRKLPSAGTDSRPVGFCRIIIVCVDVTDAIHVMRNLFINIAQVVVTVNDVNDEEPVFSEPLYTFQIAENAAEGTEVGHVSAVDRDMYPFNRHVFKIVDAYSTGAGNLFAIDPKSGRIIATAVFDREVQDRYGIDDR